MGTKSNTALGLFVCLLALGGALAQQQQGGNRVQSGGQQQPQQQQTQQPGAVTGQVLSATTSEPLRKVSLTLQPAGGRGGNRAATTSDNGGMFRFDKVDPGTYTLTGDRTGYVRGAYGEDQQGGEARRIEVATGQTASGIQLKLIPHSVVAGRVFDEDGDPVEGAQVQVSRYTYARGQRQMSVAGQSATNDLGEYRISGLPPGRYFASANTRTGGRGRGRGPGGFGGPNDNDVQEGYIATYYPRTAAPGSATPLDLVPGSEVRGIDIGLLKERFYTISGIVEGVTVGNIADALGPLADQLAALQDQLGRGGRGGRGKQKGGANVRGANIPNVQVNLIPRDQTAPGGRGGFGAGARVDQTGAFEVASVPPGSYYLTAQTRAIGGQQQMTARMAVDITSSNVQNLRLRLQPPVDITGKIIPEKPDTDLQLSKLRLNFTPVQPGLGGGRGGGNNGRLEIDDAGAFQTQLAADTYNVELSGQPQGYYLKAVKVGGREVPDAQLDLSFAIGPMEIVLGADAGSITGKVENGNDVAASVRVTAVPASGSSRRDLFKAATTADDGTFTLADLPPGEYKLYAWEEVEGNSWMDAEFRRPFESLASTAEVKGTLTPSVTLRMIGKDQLAAAGIR